MLALKGTKLIDGNGNVIKDAVVLLICGGPILWFYAVSYWLYRLIKLLVESLK